VLEPRHHLGGSVPETDEDVKHLGRKVPVGESPDSRPASPRRVDPDIDRLDVRLQRDGVLDGPSEVARGPTRDGDPKVLVEDPPELDAGFEEERLPPREACTMDDRGAHGPGGLETPRLF
jgi:hypothetical protein